MRNYLVSAIVIVSALGVLSLAPVVASAQSSSNTNQQVVDPLVVPVNTIVRGDAGSEHKLADITIINGEYKVKVVSENQSSVHPDSDIYIRTNGDEVVVRDVESDSFVEKTAEGTLNVTDGQVAVYLKLGTDKVFSGGVKVVLTYVPPQEDPKNVEVCDPETGETITVPEDEQNDYLPVGDKTCEDDPEVTEVSEDPETPQELPKTGVAALISGMVGTGALGYGVHNYMDSRRAFRNSLRK